MLIRISVTAAVIVALLTVAWVYGPYVPWRILKIADSHNGLITAGATALIGLFTLTLWRVNRRQGLDARTIQRAYVKISHPSPGIEQLDESGHIWLTISVKNHGQTPAQVTDVFLRPIVVEHGSPLPHTPDYNVDHTAPVLWAFLVTNDEFFHSRFYGITQDQMTKVNGLTCDLYMIGYVDYIDQFGAHHRGGYARQYQPMIDLKTRYETDREFAQRNNLTVVAQPGYNYDRVRRRGEGTRNLRRSARS